jgi:hypothetical protein
MDIDLDKHALLLFENKTNWCDKKW